MLWIIFCNEYSDQPNLFEKFGKIVVFLKTINIQSFRITSKLKAYLKISLEFKSHLHNF